MANTKLITHPRGSTIIMAIGIVAILMTVSLAISVVTLYGLRSTREVSRANQAYFAAESGIEEALYQMAGHDLGFESSSVANGGDPLDPSDPASPLSDWFIDNRTKEVSLDEDPATPTGGSTEDMLLLPLGSTATIGLYFDSSFPYDPVSRTYLTEVDIDLSANPDDQINLETVLPNDIRVTDAILTDASEQVFTYSEDTRVATADLDETLQLARVTLQYVDFNQDDLWSRNEPVYLHLGSGSIVEPGDIRVNTISPDFVTCTEIYQPSFDENDTFVIDGQCDTRTAMANIDNDLDGFTDEDLVDFQDGDNPTDGFIDEDPDEWPLKDAEFFVFPTDCAVTLQSCLESREVGNPNGDNIIVYADTPALTYTISAKDPDTAEEVIIANRQITKTALIDTPNLPTFTHPESASSLQDIAPPYTDELKLNLFAVLKGALFRITDPSSGQSTSLSKLSADLTSIGKSGPFRQTLESSVQQAVTVPIFNFTITY